MANVIYVGNYPYSHTVEDVLAIFEEFEGLVLLRSIRKDKKCYSFILCRDQEQVIEVVFAMNGLSVGGRNLVVRSSDEELQGIINECNIEEEYYNTSKKCNCVSLSALDSVPKSHFRQPRKPSRLTTATADSCYKKEQQHDPTVFHGYHSKHNNVLYDSPRPREKLRQGKFDQSSKKFEGNSPFNSSSLSSKNRPVSPCSLSSSTVRSKREKFTLVSVINFPDKTTSDELQELFSDYNPVKIIIKNAVSYPDNPTEAVIFFLKSEDVTDAILNLDNTLYGRRVIIVSECDDTSLILSSI